MFGHQNNEFDRHYRGAKPAEPAESRIRPRGRSAPTICNIRQGLNSGCPLRMTSPGPALPFRTRFPPALAQGLTSVWGCPQVPRMPLAQHAWCIRFDRSLWPSFWRTPAPVRGSEPVAPPSEPQAKRIQSRERSGPQARGSARSQTPIPPCACAGAHVWPCETGEGDSLN